MSNTDTTPQELIRDLGLAGNISPLVDLAIQHRDSSSTLQTIIELAVARGARGMVAYQERGPLYTSVRRPLDVGPLWR